MQQHASISFRPGSNATRRFLLQLCARALFALLFTCLLCFAACRSSKTGTVTTDPGPRVVNVVVVYDNPKVFVNGENGRRFHEIFGWNDPVKLNNEYKDSLEAFSHGSIRYNIVQVIDEDRLWTRFKDSTEYLSSERAYYLLKEKGWTELKKKETRFDYTGFVDHHRFGDRRDAGEIHEVWVWAWPYGGMYESQMVGEKAFWCNSPGLHLPNKKILTVMGFNYERTADLALHSFGHRAESIMWKVYGRWEPLKKVTAPNRWELFTALEKDSGSQVHVGNCHFPPNATHDYDYGNQRTVNSLANGWNQYPAINTDMAAAAPVSCKDWGCTQMGYMSWWMRRFPHSAGISAADGKLNNWWRYFAVWEEARELEQAGAAGK